MMKHLSIKALTCSALIAFTNPVNANMFGGYKVGDVLYCESESGAFVQAPDYEFKRWITQKFRFKIVSEEIIRFGSSGYLKDSEFKIVDWFDPNEDGILDMYLEAKTYVEYFNLLDGRFTYSSTSPYDLSMLTGTCDKF